jgi:aminomethyltransferase
MTYNSPLWQSPFHPRLAALNRLNRWGAWAGYQSALCFGDVEMEYTAIRNAATVYDLCPMIKYTIRGRDALAYLNRLTLRDVAKLPCGAVHYTAWCDDAGKVLDDGTLFHIGPDDYMLCCQERHLNWLLDSAIGFEVHIDEITGSRSALSLQGPCSASVLATAGFDIWGLKPFRLMEFEFQGTKVMVSRTGFTGDLGYELWIPPAKALSFWDHLMASGAPFGLRPIGVDALNMARIEAGFIITHMDFIPADQALRENRARSPAELGLEWMIDWDKGHFNGRRALNQPPTWAMLALDVAGNVSAEGSILYHNQKVEAGFVTAATWSPVLKQSIALAQVQAKYSNGDNLWVEIYAMRELQYAKLMLPVTVVARPFFNPPRKRATPPGRF